MEELGILSAAQRGFPTGVILLRKRNNTNYSMYEFLAKSSMNFGQKWNKVLTLTYHRWQVALSTEKQQKYFI